jgi:hypothetical protein
MTRGKGWQGRYPFAGPVRWQTRGASFFFAYPVVGLLRLCGPQRDGVYGGNPVFRSGGAARQLNVNAPDKERGPLPHKEPLMPHPLDV